MWEESKDRKTKLRATAKLSWAFESRVTALKPLFPYIAVVCELLDFQTAPNIAQPLEHDPGGEIRVRERAYPHSDLAHSS